MRQLNDVCPFGFIGAVERCPQKWLRISGEAGCERVVAWLVIAFECNGHSSLLGTTGNILTAPSHHGIRAEEVSGVTWCF